MMLGLGIMLVAGGAATIARLDADAQSYVNAVRTAGGTVSGAQAQAISDFVTAEKAANRWTGLKRLYLPIWGAATPNAIDLVTRGSGTWAGTVTHAAGYAQGNGTTGYFNTGVSSATLGLTIAAGGFTFLATVADSRSDFRCLMGASATSQKESYFASESATQLRFSYCDFNVSQLATLARASQVGIISADRQGGGRRLRQRLTSGVTATTTATVADSGTICDISNMVWALNAAGTPQYFANARLGAYAFDLGLSAADRDAFTLNLKTLWETLTGLTLP